MWKFKDKMFTEDLIGDNYGFVYCITNTTNGRKYIGRKYFWSKRTLPPLKGKKRKRHITKPSNWKTYWSSSKILAEEIANTGYDYFEREILSLHPNKTETNYAELVAQVRLNVLDAVNEKGDRIYYNENIMQRFYPSKVYAQDRQLLFT